MLDAREHTLGFKGLRSFGAILPVSFAALRSGAHAITVRTGVATGNARFACVDVA